MEGAVSQRVLDFFANYIQKKLGIIYQESNYYQLENRLQTISKQLGFTSVDALWQQATRHIDSTMELLILDSATNNETLFFRNPEVFDGIRDLVIKNNNVKSQAGKYKVWSAACSFGQEVYSLAMLFDEISDLLPSAGYSILASDISETALKSAQSGNYTQLQIQRGLPAQKLVKYFEKPSTVETDYQWRVKESLRKNIQFQKQNLLDSFMPLGSFDLILCRNVLIYQSVPSKKEILERMEKQLNPGGYLILGGAESLIGITDVFEMVRTEKVTFYKKKDQLLLKKVG